MNVQLDDIDERAEKYAKAIAGTRREQEYACFGYRDGARAERERLKNEIEDQQTFLAEHDENVRLHTDVERLRAALEEIVERGGDKAHSIAKDALGRYSE